MGEDKSTPISNEKGYGGEETITLQFSGNFDALKTILHPVMQEE